jgi:hypothetical protein
VRSDEFFRVSITDDWGEITDLDVDKLTEIALRPLPGDDDLQSARSLLRITHDEYKSFGTDGQTKLANDESSALLKALVRVLDRHGIALDVPWRDFEGFRGYWIDQGMSGGGGWEARRKSLRQYFDPVHDQLERLEEAQYLSELAQPVSPRSATGWSGVDTEIAALRQRFKTAAELRDYRDVGNRSVAVLEMISASVYEHAVHGLPDSTEPPVSKTDITIGAYIDAALPGGANEELRGLVKKASAVAHKVKHSPTGSRRDAGMIADAVILVANLLRRLVVCL